MLQPRIRIATILMLSGIATSASAAPPGVPHAAPAAPAVRAAPPPAIRAAPAPHISAPHLAPQISAPRVMATPHVAPQVATPHVTPQVTPHLAPQQFAKPSGATGGNDARHASTPTFPRIIAVPAQQGQQRAVGRDTGGQPGNELARPNLNVAKQPELARPNADVAKQPLSGRMARTTVTTAPARQFQLAGVNPSAQVRALHNPSFANRRAGATEGAAFARAATFQGRFAGLAGRHHFRHFRPIVIGWVGPLFWPYAYNDFVDYTFYPYAYDTFWTYAYDDVYDGMFGRYAYAGAAGGDYAAIDRRPGAGGGRPGGPRTVDLCSGQTAGLTDWPIERIAQTVEANDAQRAALDGFRQATAQALDILKASCPTDLPSTPTGRIEAMRARLEAMLQAVQIVRPALEQFYRSLNDEQKARFNALGQDDEQQQSRGDLAQVCSERASGIGSLPIERIERAVGPNDAQRATLRELQDAMADAANRLKMDCPAGQALTPVGRLAAMEQRLDAMLRAVQTVQPALEKFYGSLSDEQKERFNRLSPAQG
jgi:LTXXQ motif family protein